MIQDICKSGLKKQDHTRVRFAPSPTGYLHIGGARTALYNYLFAKKTAGKFIIRIEDTDVERSIPEYIGAIFNSINWLGLEWDEGPFMEESEINEKGEYGPYLQSKRTEVYRTALEKLLYRGEAYKCYCTAEELKDRREKAIKTGEDPGYDGRCRKLTKLQEQQYVEDGVSPAYRIKIPEKGSISFNDIIKGKIEIDLNTIKDFVVMKSTGIPTYNFACAVDDYMMKITHVIRGDDHIYNTPKQILICRALGVENSRIPEYAHLPQVHGTDGKKLSKRTGAVSVEEYSDKGYLPEAMRNFLALIGWSTHDSQQLFRDDELIKKFDLTRCNSSKGIFDVEKLNWMNGKYIRDLNTHELAERSRIFLKSAGIENITGKVLEAISLEKEKYEFLSDIPKRIDFMINDDIEYDEKSVNKRLKKEGVEEILNEILEGFKGMNVFSAAEIEDYVRLYCQKNNLGAGKVFHPLRVAVSGRMQGPGLFDMLEIIGKTRCISRIEYALENFIKK